MKQPNPITLHKTFDAHMHWRNKSTLLDLVAPYSIDQFAGGLLMPNTEPKIESLNALIAYRAEVEESIKKHGKSFLPIFTFFLSPELNAVEFSNAFREKLVHAVKYYPKGGTTNSDKGLEGFKGMTRILDMMQRHDVPLLIHGETPQVNGRVVDDFEREQVFMETEMTELVQNYPGLRIVLEHITTKAAVDFAMAHNNVYATVTPQHCMFDRRALFNGIEFPDGSRKWEYSLNKNGVKPDFMCRPILKHQADLDAIRAVLVLQAQKGFKKFGLGTDTAPHMASKKYCECGACGVYSAPIALAMYALVFEELGILDHLQTFACDIMPEFYGIKDQLPERTMILEPVGQIVAGNYQGITTPFSGMEIPWTARELK